MKKIKNWVLAATLNVCGAMMLTSCTDVIGQADNPVQPVDPVDPAAELAQETFVNESWMDRTVKPGDSFWEFALGSWLKNLGPKGRGFMDELQEAIQKRAEANIDGYDSPVAGKMLKLMTQPASDKEAEMKVISDFLATLKRDGNVSKADLIRNFGKMTDIGCPALISPLITVIDGRTKCALISGTPLKNYFATGLYLYTAEEQDTDEENVIIETIVSEVMGLDPNSPDVQAKIKAVVEIEKKMTLEKATETDSQTGISLLKRIQPASLQSLNAGARSSDGEDLKAVFKEAFHVGEETYVDGSVDEMLAMLDDYDADTWAFYQDYYVYGRFSPLLHSADELYNDLSLTTRLGFLSPTILLDFYKAILLPDCDVKGCQEILEDMRRRMGERIDALTWMSSATKQKAHEKLKAMVFSAGAPEQLFNENFQLTGPTAVEAGMQYMRQMVEYQRSCDGRPSYGNFWDVVFCGYSSMSLATVNAFYSPYHNQLVIMPAFILPEAFPSDKDNAQHYAVAHVFGHELCHGFDNEGSQYDAAGKKVNWWTDEDLARFKELQQAMIDRFNELEQAPGVPADGKKTLGENMADMGGVTLAYDLWNERLQNKGLSGQELRHQQRQFFVSYADVKRRYATNETLVSLLIDEHSADHNRVNGIDRLMDDWYDLFGVNPGDKLYVAPEDRVKIW